jgi:lipopolysaccharide/colanic/teichoic acid biosynthesis glycosyltransferase
MGFPQQSQHLHRADARAIDRDAAPAWPQAGVLTLPNLAPAAPHPAEAVAEQPWCCRRLINVSFAAVALIALAPVMLLIAILVKLSSPGPVLFVQWRVGLDRRSGSDGGIHNFRRQVDYGGRLFRLYKFRTMAVSNAQNEVWAHRADPRITRIGRFLRDYRLDELPQLINVLKGDMNVVGPRPEQPQIFQQLRRSMDQYGRRQRVRPGITGWAQINACYDQTLDDARRKLALDLEYISRHSAMEDLKIMARTVPVMLLRQGAV